MPVKIVDTSLRDGHQSLFATRMTTDEILSVIEDFDQIGYHALEVWGGATFDSCLRFLNEDPWERLRLIKSKVKHTKLQMLFRGQNILGYRHYADDVVEKFVERSLANGIDIIRVFDALNDIRNLEMTVKATKKYGGHCQIALSYTTSPVHTVDYFVDLAKQVEQLGADSLCIKDMAGVLLPEDAYQLVKRIKANTTLPLELHSHATGGLMEMTYLRAIEAGVDLIDTAISAFAGGTSQPATESFYYAFKNTPYEINLNEAAMDRANKKMTQIKDKYLENGLLNPKVLQSNPAILKYQVPGGMLSNLMSQLKDQKAMHLYQAVLEEVPRVRQDLGYPPLVTPLSQMVGTQAVFNVLHQERYRVVPKEVKEYLHGQYGAFPAPVNPIILKQIIGDDEIITYRPADAIQPEFEQLKQKYRDIARSDEDVLSIALFEKIALEFLKKRDHVVQPVVVEFEVFLGGIK